MPTLKFLVTTWVYKLTTCYCEHFKVTLNQHRIFQDFLFIYCLEYFLINFRAIYVRTIGQRDRGERGVRSTRESIFFSRYGYFNVTLLTQRYLVRDSVFLTVILYWISR